MSYYNLNILCQQNHFKSILVFKLQKLYVNKLSLCNYRVILHFSFNIVFCDLDRPKNRRPGVRQLA